jgi:hypothetical protein
MNINAEPAKRVEYYITDIINDATALIGSLIKIQTEIKQINGGSYTQKIQDSAAEITDKLYGDFVKPRRTKWLINFTSLGRTAKRKRNKKQNFIMYYIYIL